MLARSRNLAFGSMQLCITGEICAAPWPEGALACESVEAERAIRVSSVLVDELPPVERPLVDAAVWLAEETSAGTRYAVIADSAKTVIADAVFADEWRLRVARRAACKQRPVWFDVLLQLGVSSHAPHFGGLALHGACVRLGGTAIILAGPSGRGKSTLLERLMTAGAEPMSHDRTLVFPEWHAVSTPWGHDGTLAGPLRSAPLGAVLLLEHGLTNASVRLHGASGVMRVASSMVGGWATKAVADQALAVASRLVAQVPCFATSLTNDERATRHVMELFR